MAQCSVCTYELQAGEAACLECGTIVAAKPGPLRAPIAADEWLLRAIMRVFIGLVILAAAFTLYSLVHQFMFRGSPY